MDCCFNSEFRIGNLKLGGYSNKISYQKIYPKPFASYPNLSNFIQNSIMSHLLLYSLPAFITEHSDIFVAIIIGAIGGYIAEFIVPGRGYGFFTTVGIGIIGGWLGQLCFAFIKVNTDIPYFNPILRSIAGSIIVVAVFNLVTRGINPKHKEKDVYDWENE